MSKRKLTFGFAACLGLAALLGVNGCGGSLGSSAPAARAYLGTQGPGDVWTWNINNGAFTASNQTKGYTYSGTEAALPTGFMKLTISNSTDPGVTAGQSAYALELPGTALILKPAGDDTNPPIITGSIGTNPAGPQVSFNFVAVGKQGYQLTDQAYGHVTFAVTGNDYSGTSHRFEIDGTPLADGPSDFTGVNGYMTDNSVPPATGAMTPSGVCVLDYGPNNGGVIGVLQPSTNVDLAVIGAKHFKGFLINQGKTQCVTVSPNGDGTLHGAGYSLGTGVETGTFDNGSGVTITFTGQPNPGEVTVSIATSGGSEQLVAAINQVGGKYMMFCFGVDSQNTPYNVILMES